MRLLEFIEMPTTITFFPVDNGDMTLIKFGDTDATTLLMDVNIRLCADDPEDETRDVAKDLRERLKKDDKGRPYVDAFLLSHPDEDHCRGFSKHFYVGPPEDYPDDKKDQNEKRIFIREMWSSPIIFRRRSKTHKLCYDATEFCTEARRRVKANRDNNFVVNDGDRIQILGEDVDNKTAGLEAIVRQVDEKFSTINGRHSNYFSAHLLAPRDHSDDEALEEALTKNQSSVIINFTLAASESIPDGAKFLTGGDAEVFIWNRLWDLHKDQPEVLEYDLLETPHHCSWHSLSEDSWSKKGKDARIDPDARKALSQTRSGAIIVASCKPIVDDDIDPPCIGAKNEYERIVKAAGGEFYCTGEYPNEKNVEPLVFTVAVQGLQPPSKKEAGSKSAAIITAARTPIEHG